MSKTVSLTHSFMFTNLTAEESSLSLVLPDLQHVYKKETIDNGMHSKQQTVFNQAVNHSFHSHYLLCENLLSQFLCCGRSSRHTGFSSLLPTLALPWRHYPGQAIHFNWSLRNAFCKKTFTKFETPAKYAVSTSTALTQVTNYNPILAQMITRRLHISHMGHRHEILSEQDPINDLEFLGDLRSSNIMN